MIKEALYEDRYHHRSVCGPRSGDRPAAGGCVPRNRVLLADCPPGGPAGEPCHQPAGEGHRLSAHGPVRPHELCAAPGKAGRRPAGGVPAGEQRRLRLSGPHR